MAFLRPLKEVQKRFARALLTLFAILLIFGGPTYLMYIFDQFGIPRLLNILIGLAAFTVGVVLFAYLSKEERKVKTPS